MKIKTILAVIFGITGFAFTANAETLQSCVVNSVKQHINGKIEITVASCEGNRKTASLEVSAKGPVQHLHAIRQIAMLSFIEGFDVDVEVRFRTGKPGQIKSLKLR